jgi:predicted AlkP superfamily pyrophosphatase or phosphodiesterase
MILRGLGGALLITAAITSMGFGFTDQRARYVVMICIDGLKPSVYTAPGPAKVPTLRRLAREGAYAEGVIGVLPTLTFPSHTTLITGVPPAVHGIYMNQPMDPEGRNGGASYWFARDIQVPTLPGIFKAGGLTTAAVHWPATVGAEIDYLNPVYSRTFNPESLDLLRVLSHPRGLLEQLEAARGKPLTYPLRDVDRVGLAAHIVRTHRPHLTLLHIGDTDVAQHRYGPDSAEALAAIEQADADVRQMMGAVAEAGLTDRTTFVVVSDHGFASLTQQLNPNAAFKANGLLEVNASGTITRWDAYLQSAGGTGFVVLREPRNAALRERVQHILRDLAADPVNGIAAVWDEAELAKRGAYPAASFALSMRIGFYLGAGHDVLLSKPGNAGGHGFDPAHAELRSSLIMAGSGVPTMGNLGTVRMTQIAPTIASWFDLALSTRSDVPLPIARPASAGHQ